MQLKPQKFLEIVKSTPLVSVDLIVINQRDEVLLGFRKNKPAQNTWFVPGGKIMKDERISEALKRIAKVELGLSLRPSEVKLKGVYEHLYPDNFAGKAHISTHYVVIAHEIHLHRNIRINGDDQHSSLTWWRIEDLLRSPDVHPNTKAYFKK